MRTLGVYIGRFQPFHDGHFKTLTNALKKYDHVAVFIGSANEVHTTKNPWNYNERTVMIRCSLTRLELLRKTSAASFDHPDDKVWAQDIKDHAHSIAQYAFKQRPYETYLVGCKKDASSYYLDMFPEWKLDLSPTHQCLNASDIRYEYFTTGKIKNVPPFVRGLLLYYKYTPEYRKLAALFKEVKKNG